MGFTDSEGRFQLSTFVLSARESVDGAIPGEYKVTVEMIPAAPAGRNPGGPEGLKAGHMQKPKPSAKQGSPPESKVLPSIYTDLAKTPLKQVVPPPGPVELKLTKSGT
jgi:hypothetical protein